MKIVLIRHGNTDWNKLKKIQGSMDIELNQAGISQAKDRAVQLKEDNIFPDIIYSSNKKRAVKTAELIGDFFNKNVIVTDNIQEINLGNWEGKTWDEVSEIFSIEFEDWKKNRKFSNIHCGESYNDVKNRAVGELKRICEKNSEKEIVFVVTHGVVIMTILLELEDMNWEDINPKFIPKNLGYSIIDSEKILNLFD